MIAFETAAKSRCAHLSLNAYRHQKLLDYGRAPSTCPSTNYLLEHLPCARASLELPVPCSSRWFCAAWPAGIGTALLKWNWIVDRESKHEVAL